MPAKSANLRLAELMDSDVIINELGADRKIPDLRHLDSFLKMISKDGPKWEYWYSMARDQRFDISHTTFPTDECCEGDYAPKQNLQDETMLLDESQVATIVEQTKRLANPDRVKELWRTCNEYSLGRYMNSENRDERKKPKIVFCKETIPPAWYTSYRFHGYDWGIHILVDALPLYARSLSSILKKAKSRGSGGQLEGVRNWRDFPEYIWSMAISRILAHERFHFAFNLFLDMAEVALRHYEIGNLSSWPANEAKLYRKYGKDVYSPSFRTGAVEEALASSWEYDAGVAAIEGSEARWEYNHLEAIDKFRSMMRKRGPGYSDLWQYKYIEDIREASVGLLNTCLRGGTVKGKVKGLTGEPFSSIKVILGEMLMTPDELSKFSLPIWLHRLKPKGRY